MNRNLSRTTLVKLVHSIVTTAVVAMLANGVAFAAKHNRVLDIGDDAPAWHEVVGADGKSYDLEKLADAKAIVMIFTCNHCPVAQAYEQRVLKLANEAKDQGVVVVAINSNQGEGLDSLKQHAAERGFQFPYLRDETQKTARAYGATCTPHAFLINQDRKIAYMGAIDDSWLKAEEVKADYLRDAIKAVLAGETPKVTESKQVGCAIRWGR